MVASPVTPLSQLSAGTLGNVPSIFVRTSSDGDFDPKPLMIGVARLAANFARIIGERHAGARLTQQTLPFAARWVRGVRGEFVARGFVFGM
jgi:hypothetical protein